MVAEKPVTRMVAEKADTSVLAYDGCSFPSTTVISQSVGRGLS